MLDLVIILLLYYSQNGPVQRANQSQFNHHHTHSNTSAVTQPYTPFSGNMAPFYPNILPQGGSQDISQRQRTPPTLPRTPTPEPPKSHPKEERTHSTHQSRIRHDSN